MLVNGYKACQGRGTSTAGMGGRDTTSNARLEGRSTAATVGMDRRSLVPSVQVRGTNRQPSATQPIVFVFASGIQPESVVICQSPKFKSPAKKAKPWRP
ncbi:hypothetical protein ACE6H2_020308 [Prunus campanulata]